MEQLYKMKELKPFAQFQNKDEYINAMVEDLSEWFNYIYDLEDDMKLTSDNFFSNLKDGVILCKHAYNIQSLLESYLKNNSIINRQISIKSGNQKIKVPLKSPMYSTPKYKKANNIFIQRTNVESFIKWCRDCNIPDSLTFETEDLVLTKNPRNVVVCLLEIAKIGGSIGMDVPDIVKLTQEIENEEQSNIINDEEFNEKDPQINKCYPGLERSFGFNSKSSKKPRSNSICVSPTHDSTDFMRLESSNKVVTPVKKENYVPPVGKIRLYDCFNNIRNKDVKKPVVMCDFKTLDEKVKELIQQCNCEHTFPMKKLRDGYYAFGEKQTSIFVRILRNHVMVRVGGGWDVLSNYLNRHDPCRKEKAETKSSVFQSEITTKLNIQPNEHINQIDGMSQGMLKVTKNKEEISVDTKQDKIENGNINNSNKNMTRRVLMKSNTNPCLSPRPVSLQISDSTSIDLSHSMNNNETFQLDLSPKSRSSSLCSIQNHKNHKRSKIPISKTRKF